MEARNGSTRQVSAQVDEETLKKDLENYRQKALELGATDAVVIPADWVQVDERVRLKCYIGRCYNYGQSAYCPPHTPEPEFMRRAFSRFRWVVLFRNEVLPIRDFTDITRYNPGGVKQGRNTLDIAAGIESMAFADGYYLAMGFGGGSCRDVLCGGGVCQALDSGRCRFPLKVHPSMEAVGINVFGLVARVGWEIYPIYRSVNPEVVPCASSVGCVFVY